MPKLAGINHQDAVRALERLGFQVIRQGKLIILSNGHHRITLPRSNPVNAYTMGGIVRDAGLTIEQFKAVL